MAIFNSMENKYVELYKMGFSNREIARQMSCNHKTVAQKLAKEGLISTRVSSSVPKSTNILEKVCSKCDTLKSISQYQRGRRGKDYEYEYSFCNSCRKSQIYDNLNNNFNAYFKTKFGKWVIMSKRRNCTFTVDCEYLLALYHKQNGICFYTDTIMDWGVNLDSHRNVISLDKVIPELGYIEGNVVLCTNRANTIKSDQTLKELSVWMPDWRKRIEECEWLKT